MVSMLSGYTIELESNGKTRSSTRTEPRVEFDVRPGADAEIRRRDCGKKTRTSPPVRQTGQAKRPTQSDREKESKTNVYLHNSRFPTQK